MSVFRTFRLLLIRTFFMSKRAVEVYNDLNLSLQIESIEKIKPMKCVYDSPSICMVPCLMDVQSYTPSAVRNTTHLNYPEDCKMLRFFSFVGPESVTN